jgi:transposase
MSLKRDKIEEAKAEIASGASIRSVSKRLGIPNSTLHDVLSRKYRKQGRGPKTVFSESQEAKIVDWILYCARAGFPISVDRLKLTISELARELKISSPFSDGKPGIYRQLKIRLFVLIN